MQGADEDLVATVAAAIKQEGSTYADFNTLDEWYIRFARAAIATLRLNEVRVRVEPVYRDRVEAYQPDGHGTEMRSVSFERGASPTLAEIVDCMSGARLRRIMDRSTPQASEEDRNAV